MKGEAGALGRGARESGRMADEAGDISCGRRDISAGRPALTANESKLASERARSPAYLVVRPREPNTPTLGCMYYTYSILATRC